MTRHARREPPTPIGLKVFGSIMGILLVAVWSMAMVGHDVTEGPKEPAGVTGTPTPTYEMHVLEPTNDPGLMATFYVNCQAAKDAGAFPLTRTKPGYRPNLDMDRDGTACEGV